MRPQWAVSSCKNYSRLCLCASRSLSLYHFHIEATAYPHVLCESKLLPRGRKMKRQLSVLYLCKCGQRQTKLTVPWLKCTAKGWI